MHDHKHTAQSIANPYKSLHPVWKQSKTVSSEKFVMLFNKTPKKTKQPKNKHVNKPSFNRTLSPNMLYEIDSVPDMECILFWWNFVWLVNHPERWRFAYHLTMHLKASSQHRPFYPLYSLIEDCHTIGWSEQSDREWSGLEAPNWRLSSSQLVKNNTYLFLLQNTTKVKWDNPTFEEVLRPNDGIDHFHWIL